MQAFLYRLQDITNLSRSPSVLALGLSPLSCLEEVCLFLSSACCLQPFTMTAVSWLAAPQELILSRHLLLQTDFQP